MALRVNNIILKVPALFFLVAPLLLSLHLARNRLPTPYCIHFYVKSSIISTIAGSESSVLFVLYIDNGCCAMFVVEAPISRHPAGCAYFLSRASRLGNGIWSTAVDTKCVPLQYVQRRGQSFSHATRNRKI